MSNINLQKQIGQQEINVNEEVQQAPVFAPVQEMQQNMQQDLQQDLDLANKEKEAAKQTKERMKALKNMVTYNKAMHCPSKTALKGEFGRTFKSSVSDQKRSAAMENHRSRLFKKKANAQALKDVEASLTTESVQKVSNIIDQNGLSLGKDTLVDVAAFLPEKESYHSNEIARLAFGEGKEHEGQDILKAMDHMLAMLSDTELKNVRLDNDTELVSHAKELERLSWQISAFDRMSEQYGYLDKLDEDTKKAVEQKLSSVRSIAYYYKLRKDIINDPAYQSRYNDELSMDFTSARNDEEKAIGKKLYEAFLAGKEMLKLNGADEALIRKQGEPVFSNQKEHESFITRRRMERKNIKKEMSRNYGNSEIIRSAEASLRKNATVKESICEKAIQHLDDFQGDLEKRPDYKEEPYDEDKMNGYCAELQSINMSDFKIGSYWEMTEYFKENYALCDKAAHLQHEIARGIMHGWKGIGENIMISLRAKARAIDSIKKTICVVNGTLATVKGSADYTDAEWENYLKGYLSDGKGTDYAFFIPKPGFADDLLKKYRELFDEEDDTKEQTIKDAYSTLVNTSDDTEIPPEELSERKKNYNRNAFVQDWLCRDAIKADLTSVSGGVTKLVQERKGIENLHASRTFEAISAGKSAEEVKRLFDLATGNDEQQLKYYTTILDTVFDVPLSEYKPSDLGSFFDNWTKKEEAGRLATDNIMEVGQSISELLKKNPELKLPEKYGNIDELLVKTEALHHLGCALTGGRIDALQQIRSTKYVHALSIAEIGSYDQKKSTVIGERLLDYETNVRPFTALDDPAGLAHDNLNVLFKSIQYLNIDDNMQEISEEEIKEGKQSKKLNFDANPEDFYGKYLEAADAKYEKISILKENENIKAAYAELDLAQDKAEKKKIGEKILKIIASEFLKSEKIGEKLRKKYTPHVLQDKTVAAKLALSDQGIGADSNLFKSINAREKELDLLNEERIIDSIIRNELEPIIYSVDDPHLKSIKSSISDVQDETRTKVNTVMTNFTKITALFPEQVDLNAYYDQEKIDRYRLSVNTKVSQGMSLQYAETEALKERFEDLKTEASEETFKNNLFATLTEEEYKEKGKNDLLVSGITKKQSEEYGGASYKMTKTREDAKRIVAKSGGFLTAVRSDSDPALMQLKPSLPETINVNGKDIALRRNYNLFIKAYINLVTNEDGSYKPEAAEDGGVCEQFDRLTCHLGNRLLDGSRIKQAMDQANRFMNETFKPAIAEILEAKYMESNGSEDEAAIHERALAEADLCCEELMTVLTEVKKPLIPDEITLLNSVEFANRLKNADDDKIRAFLSTVTIREEKQINGENTAVERKPTNEEIDRAISELRADLKDTASALKKVRELDIDSKEIPIPNSCSANVHFVSQVQKLATGTSKDHLSYYSREYTLSHPEQVRKHLLKNLVTLGDSLGLFKETIEDYQKLLSEMSFPPDKTFETAGESEDITRLLAIANKFANYSYHVAAITVNDEEDGIITTEGMAATTYQYQVAPFTLDPIVGQYHGESKEREKGGTGIKNNGFVSYNMSDNPYVSDTIGLLKVKLKNALGKDRENRFAK